MGDDNLEEAKKATHKAVTFDNEGEYRKALCYYDVAVRLLGKISTTDLSAVYARKIQECKSRIVTLTKLVEDDEVNKSTSRIDFELQRVKLMIKEAQDADVAGCKNIAIMLYADSVQVAINIKKLTPDQEQRDKLLLLSEHAMTRAEALKGIQAHDPLVLLENLPPVPGTILESPTSQTSSSSSVSSSNLPTINKPSNLSPKIKLHRGSSAHLKVTGGNDNYTDEEKKVLLNTSHINDNEFVPFMNVDLTENFRFTLPFEDKDGLLELAPKQKKDLSRWDRPGKLFDNPRMVMGNHVDYFSIKQTVVSDCSFVASLAVSAQYEKKFGYRLITSIIYPQNRQTKEPIFNPYGKYMVKLHINGVPRKVIIDDRLPVGKENQLLCSYSSNRGELWISLLEKAYMKVMGGYDFPGSNSNIDLHALTGWIPERSAIRQNDPDFNKDLLFKMINERLHKGDVLVTVATGELSEFDVKNSGLVQNHAYALLDVREINGIKLLQLKNPWSHLRWRGNYSELDTNNWTYELKKKLNYDPDSASQYDNGIFWIDYDSICHFFDVFYLNWNPRLFNYTYCIHQMWNAGIGPIKDAYNIGDNPQFLLTVQQSNVQSGGGGALWILLSRHITEIEDFKQNQEYITVLIYKNAGKRVYYPHDPPPFIDGVRINSPHYLTKIKLNTNSETKYTLVVSQYEKMNTIYYTLRAYGTCPFTLKKIADPYTHVKEATDGRWTSKTAGGCGNHPLTHFNNPRYQLVIDSPSNNNSLLIVLKGPKEYQIGFDVVTTTLNDPEASTAFQTTSSGAFRSGFVYLELDDVPGGIYQIVPATFLPGQEGPFFLTCKASCNIQLTRIK